MSRGAPAPITLIRGPEPQLNFEALERARKQALQDKHTERQRFDPVRTGQWLPILDALEAQSLFAPKRLIEIYSTAGKLDKNAQLVTDRIAKSAGENLTVILHLPNIERPKTQSWYKTLEKAGLQDIESRELSRDALDTELKHRLQKANILLTREAYQLFLDWHEGNISAAQQAITLIKNSGQAGKTLNETDITTLLGDAARLSVHRFQEAFLQNNWLACYRAAQTIEHEDPKKILQLTAAIHRDMTVLYQLASRPTSEHSSIFQTHRIYRPAPYQAALARTPPALISANLKLAAKLDRISKGAEAGNAWLTLRQYCLLRIPKS